MAIATTYNAAEINQIVQEETERCVAALKAEQIRVGIKSYSGKGENIKYKLTGRDPIGVYKRIRFIFPRYMVFVEKGASRGHAGRIGGRWTDKKGIVIYTNPKSFGKMNTGARKAKEWFNSVIENFVNVLTDRLQQYFINVSFRKLKIK